MKLRLIVLVLVISTYGAQSASVVDVINAITTKIAKVPAKELNETCLLLFWDLNNSLQQAVKTLPKLEKRYSARLFTDTVSWESLDTSIIEKIDLAPIIDIQNSQPQSHTATNFQNLPCLDTFEKLLKELTPLAMDIYKTNVILPENQRQETCLMFANLVKGLESTFNLLVQTQTTLDTDKAENFCADQIRRIVWTMKSLLTVIDKQLAAKRKYDRNIFRRIKNGVKKVFGKISNLYHSATGGIKSLIFGPEQDENADVGELSLAPVPVQVLIKTNVTKS